MAKTSALPKSKAKTAYGLLSYVRKLILAQPLRYDQGDWLAKPDDEDGYEPAKGFPECGTVGCVAGWVKTLAAPKSRGVISTVARRVLGLDWQQTEALFYWEPPARYKPQTAAHAKRGAEHIAQFQKKYEAQLKAKRLS